MKIGFDAKRLFYNNTGLGNYSRDLVSNYGEYFPDDKIFLFSPEINNTKYIEFLNERYASVVPGNRWLWRYWRMVHEINEYELDIFHGLSNELPIGIKKNAKVKSVVTIHDLIFLKYPEFYKSVDRRIYYEKTKRSVNTADLIFAISASTKRDIINYFNINPEKIEVVYQNCNEKFYTSEKIEIAELDAPYFMYVGSVSPRKNLRIVLESMAEIKPENRIQFYIIGGGRKYKKQLEELVQKSGLVKWVVFKGHVGNEELKELYINAQFSIYPSLYEGFGIPILESQLLGTPVITSNVSSMPELVSPESILIDPLSKIEIKNAIENLSSSEVKITKKNILELIHKFSPEKSIKRVNVLYRSLIN
jgi:glycosyltransferase involved in cell wall biosynthesis